MRMIRALFLLLLVFAAGCTAPKVSFRPDDTAPEAAPIEPPEQTLLFANPEALRLERALSRLDMSVDPAEAKRLATTATDYPMGLLDRPNPPAPPPRIGMFGATVVGPDPKWADLLEARLLRDGYTSFEVHRGIAPANAVRVWDHTAVIVTAKGRPMDSGIVLDPGRTGGKLFWIPVVEDADYAWQPRARLQWNRRWGKRPFYSRNPLKQLYDPVEVRKRRAAAR